MNLPVAPLAGARIETQTIEVDPRLTPSRPSRARGLKQKLDAAEQERIKSRPSRARGLKLYDCFHACLD